MKKTNYKNKVTGEKVIAIPCNENHIYAIQEELTNLGFVAEVIPNSNKRYNRPVQIRIWKEGKGFIENICIYDLIRAGLEDEWEGSCGDYLVIYPKPNHLIAQLTERENPIYKDGFIVFPEEYFSAYYEALPYKED